ncbi:hypothetical protein CDAR_168531 [Caerostris darwini]|uniref:Uncharacterized protein n=1 Tax=Caerostris darwini TaxID=1538125 RepID=A0AAV4T6Q9_9ARAC|nr:hypothetical protein CDAR_168531 [Caerostris darwini]
MTRRSNESDVRLLLKGRMEEERDHDVGDEGDRYVCLRGHPRSDSGLALLGFGFCPGENILGVAEKSFGLRWHGTRRRTKRGL